jgi:NAD(P)-dependent dehydrogenase (short-subunit alcohol dehydrogenase family)
MPKPHSVLAEGGVQQAPAYLTRSYSPPLHKPVYYSDTAFETSWMKCLHKAINAYRRHRRFLSSFFMQEYYSPVAETFPKLKKKLVLITGGSDGIGFETALKLVLLGATVIIASNDLCKADRAAQAIRALLEIGADQMNHVLFKLNSKGPEGVLDAIKVHNIYRTTMLADQDEDHYGQVHSVYLNLADLKSVADAVAAIRVSFPAKTLDHVILGAAICPEDNVFSMQGHEIAYSTNVLGHFALTCLCMEHKLLRMDSQVMIIGCEDYILAADCTTNFVFTEKERGYHVFCSSKLGQFWFAQELQRRFSYLSVCIVHPGYCDTRLGLQSLPHVPDAIAPWLVMSPRSASSVVVICVQHSNILPKGSYFHNTCGQMVLDPAELAVSVETAGAFWETLDRIYVEYMRIHTNDPSVIVTSGKILPDRAPSASNKMKSEHNQFPRYIALN